MTHAGYMPWESPWPASGAQRPGAVEAFRVFAALMVLFCLGVAMIGGVLAFADASLLEPELPPEATLAHARIQGVIMGVFGLAGAVLYGVGALLPRGPVCWVIHLVLLALSMVACCPLPLALPILVFYVRAPVRAWFRV